MHSRPPRPGPSAAAPRRSTAFALAAAAMLSTMWISASAQDKAAAYPSRPVRLVVGFAAGGGPDIAARLYAPRLAAALDQQVVVDNRPGAGGSIAEDIVAKAPADGHTLLMCASSLSINPFLYEKLPYDTLRDLAPVSLMGISAQTLIVLSSFPAKSVKDVIAMARQKPGQLTFASSGNGAGSHLAGELFKSMAKVDLVHVPYKGGGQGVQAVLSGETIMMFAPLAAALPHVRANRLKALAVTTERRASAAPEIPTMSEAGVKGYEAFPWYGVLAPSGTPRAVIDRLQKVSAEIVAQPDMREKMGRVGIDPDGRGSAEFARFIKVEMDRWSAVIRSAGLRPN